jgi:hypothetical protein
MRFIEVKHNGKPPASVDTSSVERTFRRIQRTKEVSERDKVEISKWMDTVDDAKELNGFQQKALVNIRDELQEPIPDTDWIIHCWHKF